jgi:hypothetical protein
LLYHPKLHVSKMIFGNTFNQWGGADLRLLHDVAHSAVSNNRRASERSGTAPDEQQ